MSNAHNYHYQKTVERRRKTDGRPNGTEVQVRLCYSEVLPVRGGGGPDRMLMSSQRTLLPQHGLGLSGNTLSARRWLSTTIGTWFVLSSHGPTTSANQQIHSRRRGLGVILESFHNLSAVPFNMWIWLPQVFCSTQIRINPFFLDVIL